MSCGRNHVSHVVWGAWRGQAFKDQRYPEAVKHYTEALARGPPAVNPEAYKLYSNRAACFTKLGTWDAGLKDAEECIRLEPTFVKGYTCALLSLSLAYAHTGLNGIFRFFFWAVRKLRYFLTPSISCANLARIFKIWVRDLRRVLWALR